MKGITVNLNWSGGVTVAQVKNRGLSFRAGGLKMKQAGATGDRINMAIHGQHSFRNETRIQ